MNALTRRRDETENLEQWSIWDDDVCVGLMRKINATAGQTSWQWSCWGTARGTADTFDEAREAFQKAWDRIGPTVTQQARQAWREDEAFTAWKYAMHDAGCRLPTQSPDGWSHCFCGVRITAAGVPDHVRAAHMGTKPPHVA